MFITFIKVKGDVFPQPRHALSQVDWMPVLLGKGAEPAFKTFFGTFNDFFMSSYCEDAQQKYIGYIYRI